MAYFSNGTEGLDWRRRHEAGEGTMSDETVEVRVKLPKLEDYEFTGEYRQPQKGEWYLGGEDTPIQARFGAPHVYLKCLILRPVAPPERMVTLTPREGDIRYLRLLLSDRPSAKAAYEVLDKALAQPYPPPAEAQEVCDIMVRNYTPSCCSHNCTYNCALPKGHADDHRPEVQA